MGSIPCVCLQESVVYLCLMPFTEEATTTEASQTVITDFTGSPTMFTDGTTCTYSTSIHAG